MKLNGDLAERLCDLGLRPPVGARRRQRIAMMNDRRLLFVHVPKAAGMAVSQALYGAPVQHATIRYYQMVAPDLVAAAPTFAVVRDPVARFRSALAYAQSGGSGGYAVSEPFRSIYSALQSVDEVLDHLEAADWPYGVDHIFRPQSWYVTDARGGLAVDYLIPLTHLDAALAALAPAAPRIARVNLSSSRKAALTPRQAWRVRYLYASDLSLGDISRRSVAALLNERAAKHRSNFR